jgi:transcription antitermination factor NusG
MNWFVIYTKPKNEKKVAYLLESLGIQVYCPMVTTIKQWSDRKKKITVPLLNSYVFVKIADSSRDKVFEVPGVVRYLFWLGKPAIVRDLELVLIREMLEETYKKVSFSALQPGQQVKIDDGIFKGQTAVFKEQKGTKTILILESLGIRLILER